MTDRYVYNRHSTVWTVWRYCSVYSLFLLGCQSLFLFHIFFGWPQFRVFLCIALGLSVDCFIIGVKYTFLFLICLWCFSLFVLLRIDDVVGIASIFIQL